MSGLLACYRCHIDYSNEQRASLFGDPSRKQEVIEHLEQIFQSTPLEIIGSVLYRYDHLDETARKILDSYNEFIGVLSDKDARTRLEELTEENAEADPIYKRVRTLSHAFRDGVLAFFFDPKSELEALTKTYGVF